MPLYEYRCPECEHRFEILPRMGEGARGLSCPECGAEGVERQLSTFASSAAGRSETPAAPGCGAGGFT